MKKLFSIAILTLTFTISYSQYVREFSQDTSNYIQELTTLFGTSLMDDEDPVFNGFISTWDSLDHQNRVEIMEISELMRQRSCRPRPHYIMFLRILEEFHREGKLDLGYDNWIEGYRSFMENENTLLKEIANVNNTVFLMLDQSMFYNSSSLSWKMLEQSFDFVYDDRVKIFTSGNTLVGISSGDSIMVHDVSGYVDPVSQVFVGTSGRVFWDRAGLSRDTVFAKLQNYRLLFSRPEYKADSAIFEHRLLIDDPIIGILEDRITRIKNPEAAKYPQFKSYKSSYVLNEVVEGIDYRGAISMQGANLAGTGIRGNNALLEISNNDTVRVSMRSEVFLFGKNSIMSPSAEVAVYIENDSIYHPDLLMNYTIARELLRLTRSDDYNSQGPYSNSYHQVDMSFDELNWVRTEPVIRMQAALGTSLGNGFFESNDFFDMKVYESLQGMDYQNPLADLWTFGDMLGGSTFAVESFASYMGKAAYMIRHQLMQFTKLGFVYFDFERDMVTLRPKLYDFIEASLKRRDYDVIRFISRTSGGNENALLDLTTKDLTINGIPNIFLSDSQNVRLVPRRNQIIMKRNRNFQFDGVIDAGLFKFYGQNFFFEYDSFKINLQNIDSLSISAKIDKRDATGRFLTTELDNKIENITGELLIDAPVNKSGLESYPEYPIFTSREGSSVYFDEKSIQDGVYDRKRFYFELSPFTIDSLDNFTREALKMDGTFVSAGILPPMEMEMSLRPDNSLGFYMRTPEEGIDVFGGKAIFYNDIEMSSAGLHGYGSLDYLTSTTWSDDFLFHPDSIMTISRRFLEREQSDRQSYPYVENTTTGITYHPHEDVMRIRRLEDVFKIYTDSTFFGGNLALRPAGLSGDGTLVFPDARFESEVFSFNDQDFNADSAGVQFRKAQDEDYTFITDDLEIDVDLVKREGDFTARADNTLVSMPENMYQTRIDQVKWLMDRDEVRMSQVKMLPENDLHSGIDSLDINAPSYISTNPQQDSLHFAAPIAYFNYGDGLLNAEQVPFMAIGDAFIFPDSGKVQILQKATIKPLRRAKLLANTDSHYHLMHSANLVVDSRIHYRGSADYDYVDEFGNVYTFRMDHVEVDTSIRSFGIGQVAETDSFRLSPYYDYQGEIRMQAQKPFLDFAGGVRLTHDCNVRKYYLKFESEINPDSILIPVERPMQNIALNNIYAGTLKARDSIHIYPTFMSGRKDYFDRNVTYANGYLYYDKTTNSYEIADSAKLADSKNGGNYLALRTDSCDLYSEGLIDLNIEFGRISLKSVGNATHKIDPNTLKLNLVMGMDFYFSQDALNIFGREMDSLPGLDPVDLTTSFYQQAITDLAGRAQAEKLDTELGLYGSYSEIPDSLDFSILFNDLSLEWNQETRSFRHNGKVGIGIIGDVQVNRKVDAYVEFVERGSGDIFDIYLQVDDNTWYYMAYSPGGFQVLSSNQQFNDLIFGLPAKERRLKSRGRQPSYIYSLASSRRMALFLDRFRMFDEQEQE